MLHVIPHPGKKRQEIVNSNEANAVSIFISSYFGAIVVGAHRVCVRGQVYEGAEVQPPHDLQLYQPLPLPNSIFQDAICI